MDACTSASAVQLLALVFTFLLAVIWLDMFWVRIPEELHHGNFPGALRKRGWVNAFVAAGAAGAAVLLLLWVNGCAHGAL
jgi:hypothetical protein